MKIFSFPLKVVKIDEVPFQSCEDSEPIGGISDLKTPPKAQNGPKFQKIFKYLHTAGELTWGHFGCPPHSWVCPIYW